MQQQQKIRTGRRHGVALNESFCNSETVEVKSMVARGCTLYNFPRKCYIKNRKKIKKILYQKTHTTNEIQEIYNKKSPLNIVFQ